MRDVHLDDARCASEMNDMRDVRLGDAQIQYSAEMGDGARFATTEIDYMHDMRLKWMMMRDVRLR